MWVAWNFLSKVRPFSKVDDALGVIYTHGIAGFFGGLLLGIFGDPNMLEYGCGHLNAAGQVVATYAAPPTRHRRATCVPFSVNGLMYTGSAHQLWEQFRAAVFVIFWSALVTFILMKLIGLVLRGARYKDEILEVGDLAIHGEEAFPEETFAERDRGRRRRWPGDRLASRRHRPTGSGTAAAGPVQLTDHYEPKGDRHEAGRSGPEAVQARRRQGGPEDARGPGHDR